MGRGDPLTYSTLQHEPQTPPVVNVNKRKMASGVDTVANDVVVDLLSVPFSRRPFNEKMDIVKKGRPTPEQLEISQASKAGYERHFQASNWERYPWLTGSVVRKKLYCWECLLFGTDKGAWNWRGYDNLSSLTKSAQKHEGSASHLKATITLNFVYR